jgi:hypothetical protein
MSATAKQVEVKERPIIFSGPMVKAILEGRKTQTRRVVKPLPIWFNRVHTCSGDIDPATGTTYRHDCLSDSTGEFYKFCPYGAPQGRLWVRETWQPIRRNSPEQDAKIKASLDRLERGEVKDIVAEVQSWPFPPSGERQLLYAADFGDWAYDVDSDLKPWRSPLFLPRELSRITLEIISVRVQRVQSITEADAIAEGVDRHNHSARWPDGDPGTMGDVARRNFARGWDYLNAKRGYSWDSNPWVWVIEFKKLEAVSFLSSD